ncbi:MAG: dihydropteroate synthase [Sphingomonas sp.]|uniref:dihydropteroate synthase n=1 Tax=Sphingomonas sp. TaxID=28214 RepID=UPI000DB1D960|nr:dihydropteroate synthase [Zymomonas sp.]MBA4772051.1 dihydropteroate synthase [Sphingomonas sp.]PZP11315.1 MAG: dihydropteroate synthase [Sphingomonas hengshuiensis]
MTQKLYLLPTQFVDSPIGRDGAVARLAGGMQWFAAYDVIEGGARRTLSIADFAATLGVSDARAAALHAAITAPRAPITLGERVLRLDQPHVVGILNVTPDSFSDGGKLEDDPQAAAEAGFDMIAAGAALIDLGGESTRPGAALVWEGDEIKRIAPVVERLARAAPVSIDTRKAAVMEAALERGAHMVNDVSALVWDSRSAEVVAKAGVPVVLMHSPDPAKGPHGGAQGGKGYADPLIETFDWLAARVEAAVMAGIDRAKIIVDPGIGFGKALSDNLALLGGLALFHGLGCPIMLGASRKRIIGALSNEAPVGERLGGSLALALKGAEAGVQLLRVHDVGETVQAIRVWRGMRDAALVGR